MMRKKKILVAGKQYSHQDQQEMVDKPKRKSRKKKIRKRMMKRMKMMKKT